MQRWSCSWLCSSPSSLSVSLGYPFQMPMAHTFFLELLFIHCQGVCHTLSKIPTKFDVHPLIHCEIASGQVHYSALLQGKGHKNQHGHPAAWNVVH
jgi:hypothetical protein